LPSPAAGFCWWPARACSGSPTGPSTSTSTHTSRCGTACGRSTWCTRGGVWARRWDRSPSQQAWRSTAHGGPPTSCCSASRCFFWAVSCSRGRCGTRAGKRRRVTNTAPRRRHAPHTPLWPARWHSSRRTRDSSSAPASGRSPSWRADTPWPPRSPDSPWQRTGAHSRRAGSRPSGSAIASGPPGCSTSASAPQRWASSSSSHTRARCWRGVAWSSRARDSVPSFPRWCPSPLTVSVQSAPRR
jgi:hypothetical protein